MGINRLNNRIFMTFNCMTLTHKIIYTRNLLRLISDSEEAVKL